MRIRFLLVALAILAGASGASAVDYFSVTATVKDKVTDADLTEGHVRILNAADSSLVKEQDAFRKWMSGSPGNYHTVWIEPQFTVNGLDRSKKYILELTHERYEPLFRDIDPSTMKSKATELSLGTLRMSRAKVLNEVTVTATKVKFYNRGDTIVYNADAFVLAEGSMLDALIAQLPGVELKENGQIFVNGRFVENLLLNGKDFFKGNNKIMLENLGAYTVKNIEVYDGQNEMDRIMGKDYGKKELTMDVKLKREYMRGFLLNAEAGYGTENRYLGQLFGLLYNDNSRFSFFGNANNLSNTWNPSQYSSGYRMPTPDTGDIKTYSGGLDYNAKIPHTPFSFEGSAEANYQSKRETASKYTTNFLPAGDTYGYSFSDNTLRQLTVKTSHQMKVMKEKWNLQVNPKFEYVKNDNTNSLSEATFTREWDDTDRSFIDAIYSNSTAGVLESLINRNLSDRSRHGHSIWANVWSNGKFKMPNETDAVTYLAAYTYKRMSFNEHERFLLDFGNDPAARDFADRRYANHPDFNWRAKGSAGYIWNATRGLFFDIYYTYQRYHSRSVSDLFAADNYNDASDGGIMAGLPSATEHYLEFDPDNSFDSRYREESHQLNVKMNWDIQNAPVKIYLEIPVNLRRQWLDYTRGDIHADLRRDKFFLGDLTGSVNINSEALGWIYIGINRKVTSPDMVDMVDFTNRLDPLNIRRGNKNLKDMASDNIRIYLDKTINQQKEMAHGYGINFTAIENALAYGYTYDRATGVKTGSMYNVSGNWNISAFQEFKMSFGPLNRFFMSQATRYEHYRSADLIGTDEGGLGKNIVNRNSVSERVQLGYIFGKNRIIANFNGTWSRYTSGQQGFTPFNAWDLTYGVTGNFRLPANFGIQTDLNIYTRRGYSDPSLNKDNFVWNARVTYSLMNGNLLLMADGYDLLHNLSNVFYTVNAQARTETYTNTLPRYFMFHIQWKFHKLPKNKKK